MANTTAVFRVHTFNQRAVQHSSRAICATTRITCDRKDQVYQDHQK